MAVKPLIGINTDYRSTRKEHAALSFVAAGYYDGITAAHGGAPLNLTAIGHSYGSLTTGLALQQSHGVSTAIFYGSPGVEAATPAQLGLAPGRVFVMQAPDDAIAWRYDAPPILRAAAVAIPGPFDDVLLRVSEVTGTVDFGPNPATNPNFTQLATGPTTLPNGMSLEGAHGHSEYPRFPDDGGLRTTNYNIANVSSLLKSNTSSSPLL
jgi:hypothetical protein